MYLRSIMLNENTRRDIRRALAHGEVKVAVIPTGATEQHNEHLAMAHDSDSAVLVSGLAAEAVKPLAVVTPPIAVGISEHWMDHKGTLSLTADTFASVLHDYCHSLCRHGLKHILVVNGHAGNRSTLAKKAPELSEELGIQIEAVSYWDAYSKELIAEVMETPHMPAHAAEFETSVAIYGFPQNVHFPDEPYPADELTISDTRQRENDPMWYEHARLATADKGKAFVDAAVAWLVEKIRAMSAE